MPAVRWFFRQRADRVIELPSFKLPRRSALIPRLTHDPELLGAAEYYARENGLPVAVAMSRVERYAHGIVPSFNAFLYFRVGMPLAAWICNSIYDVRVGQEPAVHILDEEATVVFVMNHRSNLDYLLLAHLMARRTAISFAAGEWADARPLGPLIRGMGAFFVRRGSGEDL